MRETHSSLLLNLCFKRELLHVWQSIQFDFFAPTRHDNVAARGGTVNGYARNVASLSSGFALASQTYGL